MTVETQLENLAAALAKAVTGFQQIKRDKTVKVQTRTGGSYTFSYAPLESILHATAESLAKNGLTITQGVVAENGGEYVETTLLHSSGQRLSNKVRVLAKEEGPQAYGSALTYARRYGITLLLGICADDDDDANAAEGNQAVAEMGQKAARAIDEIRAILSDDMEEDKRAAKVRDWHERANRNSDFYLLVWDGLKSEPKVRSAIKTYVEQTKPQAALGANGRRVSA